MMWTTIGRLMALTGLFFLMESSIASAQIFQWTRLSSRFHGPAIYSSERV
jgi:hypothetical protein